MWIAVLPLFVTALNSFSELASDAWKTNKKKYVTFSTSDRFQKAWRYIYTNTHMYVYFRETNQVTKARERMEAAASEENVHKVVLFGCASPPCSADIYLERFYLIKK